MPTMEPTTVMPFSTVSKIGSLISFSRGEPRRRACRRGAASRIACSNEPGATASAIAWSAPPSCWIAATGSSFAASTTHSAPSRGPGRASRRARRRRRRGRRALARTSPCGRARRRRRRRSRTASCRRPLAPCSAGRRTRRSASERVDPVRTFTGGHRLPRTRRSLRALEQPRDHRPDVDRRRRRRSARHPELAEHAATRSPTASPVTTGSLAISRRGASARRRPRRSTRAFAGPRGPGRSRGILGYSDEPLVSTRHRRSTRTRRSSTRLTQVVGGDARSSARLVRQRVGLLDRASSSWRSGCSSRPPVAVCTPSAARRSCATGRSRHRRRGTTDARSASLRMPRTARRDERWIDTSPKGDETMKKILIATDGSPSAVEALEFGLDLAGEEEAEAIVVHVVPSIDSVPRRRLRHVARRDRPRGHGRRPRAARAGRRAGRREGPAGHDRAARRADGRRDHGLRRPLGRRPDRDRLARPRHADERAARQRLARRPPPHRAPRAGRPRSQPRSRWRPRRRPPSPESRIARPGRHSAPARFVCPASG